MQHSIAIDVMGGDHGIKVTVPAAIQILQQYLQINIILVGNEVEIKKSLSKLKESNNPRVSILNTTQSVEMDESPQSALKNKKKSSMRLAINLVKSNTAAACVSAGNTGALMATARFVLKMLPGIERPAIASNFPNRGGGVTCVLDLGANTDSTPEQLLQFSLMGAMLTSALTGKKNPSVGLLNIGSEDIKGNEIVKKTFLLLKESHLNFYGNVEGDDIFKGTTDVVVCDGFVGNVALKTTEGVLRMFGNFLSAAYKKNFITKIIALISLSLLKSFRKRLDPRRYNGASFLGLNGIVIKSHGGADILAFKTAIITAIEESENKVIDKIKKQIEIESN
ncbi:phosphate acyltransferase PlsX [Methylophilaceae bacterium]|jgi:phosphate acyltransferase|nr:phosphate acyltransferase PlsX [Methylophilaceae bacterium]